MENHHKKAAKQHSETATTTTVSKTNLFGKVALLVNSGDKNVPFIEILEVLKNKNIDVSVVDVLEHGFSLLDRKIWQDFSRVFIAITSENKLSVGYIQGLLDILGLEYTGCGMLAAALAGDLIKSKKIWQMHGIATAPFIKWKSDLNWEEMISLVGFPLAIKSVYLNDSKIFKVLQMSQLAEVLEKFDNLNDIIIEPWVAGEEYVVYIVNNKPLCPLRIDNYIVSEPELTTKVYKNHAKQLILNNEQNNLQKLALEAYLALGCSGVAGVNIIKDLNNDCWVVAVNTAPVISFNSHFAAAAYNFGINFDVLVEQILSTSLKKNFHLGNESGDKSIWWMKDCLT